MSKRIAIFAYANDTVGKWDPDSKHKGLAGSEEAIIYACKELSLRKLGKYNIQVDVFANPPNDSKYSDIKSNPRYLNIDDLNNQLKYGKYTAVICWRRTDFKNARAISDNVYFWPHDLCIYPIDLNDLSNLKGVFWLSEFHRFDYIKRNLSITNVPYVISGNGIDLNHFSFDIPKRNKYSCIYISNYSRGLSILIDIWPGIKSKFPQATLDIYYGRQTWGTMSNQDLNKLVSTIAEYKSLDVIEHGQVGHLELAIALSKASILAYPCNTASETYCISLVKAQVAGCIPVTTTIGALKETTCKDGYTINNVNSNKGVEEYKQLLLKVMADIDKIDRKPFVQFGKERSWSKCVNHWLDLMF